ncbi:hypothetical protein BKA70DRAFT_1238214 [Coprinopsis sp. MPI-PUGE-AT-0042]|nr:hypothetical protein BKA70DRAFT_1238214 [Coprinopsis sp. MPI-PUGE-AT-0042]
MAPRTQQKEKSWHTWKKSTHGIKSGTLESLAVHTLSAGIFVLGCAGILSTTSYEVQDAALAAHDADDHPSSRGLTLRPATSANTRPPSNTFMARVGVASHRRMTFLRYEANGGPSQVRGEHHGRNFDLRSTAASATGNEPFWGSLTRGPLSYSMRCPVHQPTMTCSRINIVASIDVKFRKVDASPESPSTSFDVSLNLEAMVVFQIERSNDFRERGGSGKEWRGNVKRQGGEALDEDS